MSKVHRTIQEIPPLTPIPVDATSAIGNGDVYVIVGGELVPYAEWLARVFGVPPELLEGERG